MADILIRGMELPRDCSVCELSQKRVFACSVMCPITGQTVGYYDHGFHLEKHDCPLVPLPEGHGRLTDADELFDTMRFHRDHAELNDVRLGLDEAVGVVMNAPTIVPEEGDADND